MIVCLHLFTPLLNFDFQTPFEPFVPPKLILAAAAGPAQRAVVSYHRPVPKGAGLHLP